MHFMWICFERKKAKVGQNSSCFSSGMHNFGLVLLLVQRTLVGA